MARANFVKAARQDYPQAGIKKGESYYWWKFRYGGKHMSKTPPKPSQLTQSNFLSQFYSIQERIAELSADSSLPDEVEEIISDLRSLADECESNRDNMPDELQDGDAGTLLQERAEACNNAADELEGIDLSEFEEDEDQREKIDCSECGGSGAIEEDGSDCSVCDGSGKVPDESADPKNSDGETEDEYWAAKLEEVQGVSIDAS